MMDIRTGILNDNDQVAILHLKGVLDFHSAHEFSRLIVGLNRQNYYKILLSCKELHYISDQGLGAIFDAHQKIKKNSGCLIFIEANSEIQNLLSLLKIANHDSFTKDLQQAKIKLATFE